MKKLKEEKIKPGKRVFNHHVASLDEFMYALGYEIEYSSSSVHFTRIPVEANKRYLKSTQKISIVNAVRLHNCPELWKLTHKHENGRPIMAGSLHGGGEIYVELHRVSKAFKNKRLRRVRLYQSGGNLCLHSLTNRKEDDYVYTPGFVDVQAILAALNEDIRAITAASDSVVIGEN